MSEEFDQSFWEEHYRAQREPHRGDPNAPLVTEAADLAPGRALDAGCGEGADAFWLAARGWRVTAVDVAENALRRARAHADSLSPEVAGRIDWIQGDLTDLTPVEGHFDLVTSHYVHVAVARDTFYRRLAAAVAPGGTLLVVGHHHPPADEADHHPSADDADHHGPAPESYVTVEEAAAVLDRDTWDVAVAEARKRTVTDHDGHTRTLHDAVLRAHRRS